MMLSYHISATRRQTDQERMKEMSVEMRLSYGVGRRMLEEIVALLRLGNGKQ